MLLRVRSRWMALLLLMTLGRVSVQTTEVDVRIVAPGWVARGGSATLRCIHQVPPQLLYKVEFLRAGSKVLQYVRERIPPYTNYTFPGGKINMALVTEDSVTLENLDPRASGLYWCEVSLETPIFTAVSRPHQLTVVYSQKHPPIITFGKPDVVVGGLLRANCTSAPAAPAPKLSWYIDNEKVSEESIRFFSYRVSSFTRTKGGGVRHKKYQHRYIAPELNYTARYWTLVSETTVLPPADLTRQSKCTVNNDQNAIKLRERPREIVRPVTSLWVSIAELRTPAHGRLRLTCTATIPDEVGPGERFADIKKQTVTVAVNELNLKIRHSETTYANASAYKIQFRSILFITCGILFKEIRLTLSE